MRNRPKISGWLRLLHAAGYSANGLAAAYRNEAAFRQEVWVGVPAIILAWLLPISIAWSVLLTLSILALWVVELINSALEVTLDRITTAHDEAVKVAKDIASAAVLLTLLGTIFVWLAALWQLL